MLYISNLGGRCMGHYSLSKYIKEFDEKIEYINCPTGNMVFLEGFSGLHKLFDGTFYNTLFNNFEVLSTIFREKENAFSYILKDLRIVHGNPTDKNFIEKLLKRWNEFFEKITDENIKNNIHFFYTLNEYDLHKPTPQILREKEILELYINTNNLYILGSIPIDDPNYKNFKYNYRNDNFREVFGDHYFEVIPSNDHYLACKFIYDKLKQD